MRKKRRTPKRKKKAKESEVDCGGREGVDGNVGNRSGGRRSELNLNFSISSSSNMRNERMKMSMDLDDTLPLPQNIMPHVNMNIPMNPMLSSGHHPNHIANAAILPRGHRNVHGVHHG